MSKIKVNYIGDLRTKSKHLDSNHVITTDAPKDNQGLGRKFSPTDLVASALGSCLLTIMGIVASRKQIDKFYLLFGFLKNPIYWKNTKIRFCKFLKRKDIHFSNQVGRG